MTSGLMTADGVPGLSHRFDQHQPVVTGGFHADPDGIGCGGVGYLGQQLLEALATVGHGEVAEHRGAVLIKQGGMVSAFGDVDAEGVHETLLAKREVEAAHDRVTPAGHVLAARSGNRVPSSGKCNMLASAV